MDFSAFPNEKSFRSELEEVAKRNLQLVPAFEIGFEDVAELTLESDVKKYDRDIKITVGKNLFSRELEKAIIGMKQGQTKTVKVDGKNVFVRVNAILRKQLPQVTDEIIAGEKIDNVTTVEDFRKRYFSSQKEQAVIDITHRVLSEIISDNKFYIDEEEVEYLVEQSVERCRRLSREEGKIFEEMTPSELVVRVAANSVEQFRLNCAKYYSNSLKICAISLLADGIPREGFDLKEGIEHALFCNFKKYIEHKIQEKIR